MNAEEAGQAQPPGRNPGDEAAPGTPQTGEAPCPVCKGSGRLGKDACANCGGTGVIVQNVGDA